MTKREFDKVTRGMIEPVVAPLGFTEVDGGWFKRTRGGIADVFALDPTPDVTNFYVLVGVHVVSQRSKSLFIDGVDQPAPEIGHRLGQPLRSNHSFGCATIEQLNKYVPRMLEEFKATAIPWFDRFPDLAAVAGEFKRRRIDEPATPRPPEAGPRPPDPHGWAIYGWMLEEVGRTDEARSWLQRAYEEIRRPLFMKDGLPTTEGTRGARRIGRLRPDERLEELLRQSLGLAPG